jgi:outer membrane protein TolC
MAKLVQASSRNRNRPCPNSGLRRSFAVCLFLNLSVLFLQLGCRSPRVVKLNTLGTNLTSLKPLPAQPSPAPGDEIQTPPDANGFPGIMPPSAPLIAATTDPLMRDATLRTPLPSDASPYQRVAFTDPLDVDSAHVHQPSVALVQADAPAASLAALIVAAQEDAAAERREDVAKKSDELRSTVEETTDSARNDDKSSGDAAAKDASADATDAETLPPPIREEQTLSLEAVVVSATETFPAIREAALIRSLAIGDQISAMGEFDDKLEAYTINQPLSFYENYRHGVDWKKPLWMGGTAYMGYRLGDGDFEPWYRERETNEGGEFKLGFDIPLLQNRAIDPRRTAVRLASLDIQRANPELFQQILQTQYEAASAYWVWFAAAKQYAISLELMELAEERVSRIETQIELGDVARIVGIDNRRLLATRRAKLIESRQKLESAAIKLSLYFRDPLGRPITPTTDAQPKDFPVSARESIDVPSEVTRALTNRPELQLLGINAERLRTELRLAINQRLPEISFGTEVSQDVGGLASSSGDKQPLILETGLMGSVPVQRRKAIGKAQSLRAKIAQLDAKRQLASDKIVNDVRQAATFYEAARERLAQAKITQDLARQTLDAGELSFTSGDIDILLLNIYEQAFADAGIELITAQADLLTAEAMLSVATGQSLLIDDSVMPLILRNIP